MVDLQVALNFLREFGIGAIGGAIGGLAFVKVLANKLLDIQVSRLTERFRDELEQKSAKLKNDLSIHAHEQNVGWSRLDQQRSDAICLIYEKITNWHDLLMDIDKQVTPNALDVKQYYTWLQELMDAADAISTAWFKTAIFFSKVSSDRIASFSVFAVNLSVDITQNTFGRTHCCPIVNT